MKNQPKLLFYCQHSLGMGHLVRAFHLTTALAAHFEIVFLNGGQFPQGFTPPENVTLINLPPLGMDEQSQLVSLNSSYTVAEAQTDRHRLIQMALDRFQPDVIVVELFPFGRKKFAEEITSLLKTAESANVAGTVTAEATARPLVFCSLRDILVSGRHDQQRHDDRAAEVVNRYFDGVLVHTDPRFARIEETFHPTSPLEVPVHYTGFVTAEAAAPKTSTRAPYVLVSAGGGMVGYGLLNAAIGAQRLLWHESQMPMRLVAGPFMPEVDWQALHREAEGCPGVELIRSVPNLGATFFEASASVSQCGYNTVMDILSSRVPALVVPFAAGREDEQMNRAERLAKLHLLNVLEPSRLSATSLAAAIRDLRTFNPAPVQINLDGASTTAALLRSFLPGYGKLSARKPTSRLLVENRA
jgi:predicted glycosyltransferase